MLVMRLFRQQKVLTQICGNNFMVLKSAPPLIADEDQIEQFVQALTTVVDDMHRSTGFWTESLGLARRAMNI
jgi:ornithine--oxo-acid transaminase